MGALKNSLEKLDIVPDSFTQNLENLFIPVEHPEEFESESVHSTGRGNEKSVHSCLRSDLT